MVVFLPLEHEYEHEPVLLGRKARRGEVVEDAVQVDLSFGGRTRVVADGGKTE